MNALSLQLNHTESDFLIKVRKKITSYLKNRVKKSSGYVIVKNNTIENVSLEFELEISKENEIKKNGIIINNIAISNENIISFKSLSFQKINPNINFIKGHLTINNITKVIELEAYTKIIKEKNEKSKVVFELIGEINKSDFSLGLNEKVRINGKAIGKQINIEGNFEFYN
ncbi:YceI family protein [uncultured Flavobacterium sp.]|uniref:YceI family protein n=1 Tax=uncultured Flavobacterium sp. TaxID=165435 RepID=UPI0030C82BA5